MVKKRRHSSFIREQEELSSSGLSIQHFEATADPEPTLRAPVTEIALLKPRETQSLWEEEVNNAVAGIKEGLYFVEGAHPPMLWGEIKQAPGSYHMLVGWDTVEVRGPIRVKFI